jgi:hypothetical protein
VPWPRRLAAGFTPRRSGFEPRSDHVGFLVDKVTRASFLRVLCFPLPILIPPNVSYSPAIRGGYNRPISDRSTKWTQSHPTPRKIKKKKVCYIRDSCGGDYENTVICDVTPCSVVKIFTPPQEKLKKMYVRFEIPVAVTIKILLSVM